MEYLDLVNDNDEVGINSDREAIIQDGKRIIVSKKFVHGIQKWRRSMYCSKSYGF